mmetsp:Transcript_19213/g.41543  ORF Transcript_19213/g.41543 Transcript_19213/m.41543 type:complete len:285 (-) Transcript_19213:1787-2641(-)|eukprot:CAMPEP_0178481676 /NCGR_PEP_ID=MMETSP0696-20121128/6339_1 /TAXON_ID=265572 /ORGANISM="Extubocellulus spinifer, Strain CCMP396" /LENGTH=284 /DNA_ID=CAMNT_0020109165 /DNA_START=31 /DNA_END=885 /DNA_ORIENTATION=+
MEKVTEIVIAPISGACAEVSDRTEEVLERTDDLIVTRLMRFANHLAALFMLKTLLDKAGIILELGALEIKGSLAGAFDGMPADLQIAAWCYNIWAVFAILQICSVARSILADADELTQADITSVAVTNFFIARMIGSPTPLRDALLAAVVAGHAMRTTKVGITLHTAAVQLASAFLTTVATLGVVAAVASVLPDIPVVGEYLPNLGPFLSVVAMHGITNREDNGTIKEIVNGCILAGMAYDAVIVEGVSFALDVDTILGNITLVFLLYVTYQALDNARRAIWDL